MTQRHLDPAYRRALTLSAVLNLAMFLIEGAVGLIIGSAALIADAADFLEDFGLYSLGALAVQWGARQRARAGLATGLAMGAVGLVAVWQVIDRLLAGGAPAPAPMGITALAALVVNVFCASRLIRFRTGDASMRGIWLSTRNDAILNALTIIAALAVRATGTGWPDVAAGCVIATVNLWAARGVIAEARTEHAASG